MVLSHHLQELLLDHELVIVPGWGGFLTHYRPARLDEPRRLIHPPGRSLSFNRNLVRNDGLLADRLVRMEGLPFDEARHWIEEQVRQWRETLARDGRLELARIGLFYRDAEDKLQFDPDQRTEFGKEAFGLRPVAAVPVRRTVSEPVVRSLPIEVPAPEETRRSYGWLAAASLVLVGLAGVWAVQRSGWSPDQWSGVAWWRPVSTPSYRMPDTQPMEPVARAGVFSLPAEPLGVRSIPLTVNDSVLITVDLGRSGSPVARPDSTAVATAETRGAPVVRLHYHVVGGCFAQEENADRFLSDLRTAGHDAVRLPRSKGLHPVAFGSFATRQEALEKLAQVRQSGTSAAWLMIK